MKTLNTYLKLHIAVVVIVVISELIGVWRFPLGPGLVTLFPMLYAVVIGILITPDVLGKRIKQLTKLISTEEVKLASPLVIIALGPLGAKYGVLVGPNVPWLIKAGPALLIQEIGMVGTIFIGLPVALLLGLKREAVGATFDICREPAIAVISERYGLDSPEGIGTLGVYVCGTVFGTIWWALMTSFAGSILRGVLHPLALAMASGPGSASMMTAGSASLAMVFPEMADKILALAVASNLITGVWGVYYLVFIALPLANKLYGILEPIFSKVVRW
jgi:hypothetical protein